MQDIVFSKKIFNKYFINKRNGVLIECGAYDGFNHSIGKFFEDKYAWSCINIEPNPNLYKHLLNNRPDSFLNINKALSNKAGITELAVPKNKQKREMRGHGTIAEYRIDHESKKFGKEKANRYVVDTLTYKEIIDINNIEHVDLFILDVEGHELSVIYGMRGCKILPGIMVVEVNKIDKNVVLKALNEISEWVMDYSDSHDAFYIRKDYIYG